MLSASYININQSYILLTILFLFIFFIIFFKLHLEVYVKTSDYDCNNPLLKIYDKAKARKCMEKEFGESSQLHKNMITETGKIMAELSKTNQDYISLTDKYSRLNALQLEQRANFMMEKQQVIKDLANTVKNIKDKQESNKDALQNMITDYKVIVYKNVGKLKEIGGSIVDKLNKNIYKKNYSEERKSLIKAYNGIQKYIDTLGEREVIENDDGDNCIVDTCGNKVCINGTKLAPLSNEAKKGKKKI